MRRNRQTKRIAARIRAHIVQESPASIAVEPMAALLGERKPDVARAFALLQRQGILGSRARHDAPLHRYRGAWKPTQYVVL